MGPHGKLKDDRPKAAAKRERERGWGPVVTVGRPSETGGQAKGRRAKRVRERGWGPASTKEEHSMVYVDLSRRSDVSSSNRPRTNVIAATILLLTAVAAYTTYVSTGSVPALIAVTIIGIVLAQAPRVAQQWERAIVLRMGRFIGLRGPGLFWVVPFVDRVSSGSISGRSPPASPPSRR